MSVQVENGELSGNGHLGREGSEIAFLVAMLTFFHVLMNFSNNGRLRRFGKRSTHWQRLPFLPFALVLSVKQ